MKSTLWELYSFIYAWWKRAWQWLRVSKYVVSYLDFIKVCSCGGWKSFICYIKLFIYRPFIPTLQVLTTINLKNTRSIVHLLPYSAWHIAIIILHELKISKLAENEPASFFNLLLFFCYIINRHCVMLLKQSHKKGSSKFKTSKVNHEILLPQLTQCSVNCHQKCFTEKC